MPLLIELKSLRDAAPTARMRLKLMPLTIIFLKLPHRPSTSALWWLPSSIFGSPPS